MIRALLFLILFLINSSLFSQKDDVSFGTPQEPQSITLYPNPVENELLVSSTYKITNITIMDLLGNTIKSSKPNNKRVSLSTVGIAKGIYFVKIESNKMKRTYKVVKQ